MEATITSTQHENLRNIRIAIVHAAGVMETLLIEQSGNLSAEEADSLYANMRNLYGRLDDVVEALMDVEERDAD